MSVLYILIPLAVVLVIGFVWAYAWSTSSGRGRGRRRGDRMAQPVNGGYAEAPWSLYTY